MTERQKLSRRAFLASAGGLTVVVGLGAGYALWPDPGPRAGRVVNAWTGLLDDGRIAFVCPAQDLGQGAPLALAMILAAEIGADPLKVAVEPAPRDAATYGNPEFDGRLVTADSKTTRGYWPILRLAGAEMRAALIATAAHARGWRPEDCTAVAHAVEHVPSGARMGFDEIAARRGLRMPGDPVLRPGPELAPLGTSPADPRMLAIVTGQKRFGTDRRAADASVAVLARSRHLGGVPLAVDDAAARAVPGVEDVVVLEDAVAVVAKHTWAALKGRDALKITWSEAGTFQSEAEAETLGAALDDDEIPRVILRDTGQASGPATLTARFRAPTLKHLVPEPMNAQARGKDFGLGVTVESSTQSTDLDMRFAAQTWKTAPFMVETIAHPSGGAYGRRVLNDIVRDACAVAKPLGRPVQVIRPLVDELRHGQVRPAAMQRVSAWLDHEGRLAGWAHDFASDGPLAAQLPASLKGAMGDEDNTATDGAYHPYLVPADRIRWSRVASAPSPGFLRGVAAGYTVWAVETTIERLARGAGQDPLAFRLAHIDEPRLAEVARRAAAMAGWGDPDRALGLGVMSFRGSTVACVAEVQDDAVAGLWLAADVGRIVHRDNVLAQIMGGMVWGLSMALVEGLAYENGAAMADSIADYPVIAADALPPMEIDLVAPDPEAAPCGVGEIGVPTVIPAVANAFEAATGRQFDRLPLEI